MRKNETITKDVFILAAFLEHTILITDRFLPSVYYIKLNKISLCIF